MFISIENMSQYEGVSFHLKTFSSSKQRRVTVVNSKYIVYMTIILTATSLLLITRKIIIKLYTPSLTNQPSTTESTDYIIRN